MSASGMLGRMLQRSNPSHVGRRQSRPVAIGPNDQGGEARWRSPLAGGGTTPVQRHPTP